MSIHKETDIFRHTPLRYLGYANEVGEAFRYNIKTRTLVLAYVVSAGYIAGDTIDKTYKSYKKLNIKNDKEQYNKSNNILIKNTSIIKDKNTNSLMYHVVKSGALSFTWQVLATELIPALIVYQVVKLTKNVIKNNNTLYGKYIPTIIGLSLIPMFPYTVDPMIDNIFDRLNLGLDKEIY